MAGRHGEGAVFRGVGRKLVQREADILRGFGFEEHARSFDGDLRIFAVEIMPELRAHEVGQQRAVPAFLNQEVVRGCERLQPRAELLGETGRPIPSAGRSGAPWPGSRPADSSNGASIPASADADELRLPCER